MKKLSLTLLLLLSGCTVPPPPRSTAPLVEPEPLPVGSSTSQWGYDNVEDSLLSDQERRQFWYEQAEIDRRESRGRAAIEQRRANEAIVRGRWK